MFYYKVRVFDENEFCENVYSGIVLGNNYADAIKNLEHYYGESNICEILNLYDFRESYDDDVFEKNNANGVWQELVTRLGKDLND